MAGIINNQQSLIFSFNHGKLIVKDICEEYTDLDFTKYVCLDYIIKDGSITNMTIKENISTSSDILLNEFVLLEDAVSSVSGFEYLSEIFLDRASDLGMRVINTSDVGVFFNE